MSIEVAAARPTLMRAMNEQLMLDYIRKNGEVSRAELAQFSGLSKPTVAISLTSLEEFGFVRRSGTRTGVPGPVTTLYEVNADIGHVLALDVGQRFLRGAISDLAGNIRLKRSERSAAETGAEIVESLVRLGETLRRDLDLDSSDIVQVVLGAPGVYDHHADRIRMSGALKGWDDPEILLRLREHFGENLLIENDVNAATIAEHKYGGAPEKGSFVFLWIGTGIGMGIAVDGQIQRGAHGAAGEVGYLALGTDDDLDASDAVKRGHFDAAASAAGIVRTAKRLGMKGALTPQSVFAAADAGDPIGIEVVAKEARLVAQAVSAVVAIVDPAVIVLGGGIGRAPGFRDAVVTHVARLSPIMPEIRVSSEGDDAVVDGCAYLGVDQAWRTLVAARNA